VYAVVMMRIPIMRGIIERRILATYRVDAGRAARLLPAPFKPLLVKGYAVAGICLIRLAGIRPRFLPQWIGLRSENAAHRIAVEWNDAGRVKQGVYIPRRDTSSRLNALVGGRLFPGVHHHAQFKVDESADSVAVALKSDDGQVQARVKGRATQKWPADSIFAGRAEASGFFESGSLGYSATRDPTRFDGLELCCEGWKVETLEVDEIQSSFFEDRGCFPEGSTIFDHALLMRNVRHEWHGREEICCTAAEAAL